MDEKRWAMASAVEDAYRNDSGETKFLADLITELVAEIRALDESDGRVLRPMSRMPEVEDVLREYRR